MFTSLHALAQASTLLVVVTAEGDDQLRVNVTPTRNDDKTKPHKLRPLSLVGTPDELDEGFAAALAEWQAPRRSLVEQARDAGSDDTSAAAAKPTKVTEKKAETAPAPAPTRGKPGRKPKSAAGADAAGDAAGGGAAGAAGGDTASADAAVAAGSDAAGADAAGAAGSDAAGADAAGAAGGEAAGADAAPAADEFTLDLF